MKKIVSLLALLLALAACGRKLKIEAVSPPYEVYEPSPFGSVPTPGLVPEAFKNPTAPQLAFGVARHLVRWVEEPALPLPVVVGAGAGGAPQVKVVSVSTTLSDFHAYDSQFSGGTRVALCDIDGDRNLDVVTGAGPGGGSHVKIYHGGAVPKYVGGFMAFDGFSGGVFVACGDFEGDGKEEIVVGPDRGGEPKIKIFGINGNLLHELDAFESGFRGGVRVTTGDFDGDGLADIVAGAGPGGGPHVRVFRGANKQVLWEKMAFAPEFTGGVFVAAGDVSGPEDGRAEVVVGAGEGGGPHVKILDAAGNMLGGGFFAFSPEFRGGVRVAVGQLDERGKGEIIAGAGPGGGPHVRVFNGEGAPLASRDFMAFGSFSGGVYVAGFAP